MASRAAEVSLDSGNLRHARCALRGEAGDYVIPSNPYGEISGSSRAWGEFSGPRTIWPVPYGEISEKARGVQIFGGPGGSNFGSPRPQLGRNSRSRRRLNFSGFHHFSMSPLPRVPKRMVRRSRL